MPVSLLTEDWQPLLDRRRPRATEQRACPAPAAKTVTLRGKVTSRDGLKEPNRYSFSGMILRMTVGRSAWM